MSATVRGLSPEDGSRQLLRRAFLQIFVTTEKILVHFNDISDTKPFQEFMCYNKPTHIKTFMKFTNKG